MKGLDCLRIDSIYGSLFWKGSDIFEVHLVCPHYVAENYEGWFIAHVKAYGLRMDLCLLPWTKDTVFSLFVEFGSAVRTPFRHATQPLFHWLFVQCALLHFYPHLLCFIIQFKELLLSTLCYDLKQIIFKLFSDEYGPLDVVFIDEVLLTEEDFVLCWDILMQDIDFCQMVWKELLRIVQFGLRGDGSLEDWLIFCQYFIEASLSVSPFSHGSRKEEIIDGKYAHHAEHQSLAFVLQGEQQEVRQSWW